MVVYLDTQRKLDPLSHIHSCTSINTHGAGGGTTKGCRLSWLTKSALVYEPKCVGGGGGGGVAGSQPMSSAVHMEPNKL